MKTPTPPQTPTLPASVSSTLLADLELVHRQLYCAQWLCTHAAEVAVAMAKMLPVFATQGQIGHHMIKIQGGWSSAIMEQVGEILNGIDAVADDSAKWDKTFMEAGALWKRLTDELNARNDDGCTPIVPDGTPGIPANDADG